MKRHHPAHARLLALGFLLAMAFVHVGCQATVGVGVGFAYPGPWYGGPWHGGVYMGVPIYP